MNRKETIALMTLWSLGSVSIVVWLVTQKMLFNTIGLILLGLGFGLYLGLKALNLDR